MSDFRERLKQAARRAGAGETQAEIAASLGVSRQLVFRWFQGGEPNADMLLHIARHWGVDPTWLKDGTGEMVPPSSLSGLSGDERDLVKNYRSASPQLRNALSAMARAARKAIVTVAMAIPPLLAPSSGDARILHKQVQNTDWMRRRLRSYLLVSAFT